MNQMAAHSAKAGSTIEKRLVYKRLRIIRSSIDAKESFPVENCYLLADNGK